VGIGTDPTALHSAPGVQPPTPGAPTRAPTKPVQPPRQTRHSDQGTTCDLPPANLPGRVATPVDPSQDYIKLNPADGDVLTQYGLLQMAAKDIIMQPRFATSAQLQDMKIASMTARILIRTDGTIGIHSVDVKPKPLSEKERESLENAMKNNDPKIREKATQKMQERLDPPNLEQVKKQLFEEYEERLGGRFLADIGITKTPRKNLMLEVKNVLKVLEGDAEKGHSIITARRQKEMTRISMESSAAPTELPSYKEQVVKEGPDEYFTVKEGKRFLFKSYVLKVSEISDEEISMNIFRKGEDKPIGVLKFANETNTQAEFYDEKQCKKIKILLLKFDKELMMKFALEGEEPLHVPLTYMSEKVQAIGVALVSGAALLSAHFMDKLDQITLHFKPSGHAWLDSITHKINGFVDTVTASLGTTPTVSWKGFVLTAVFTLWVVTIPKILIGARNRKKNHQEVSNNESNN
jgi:hypothetical protein